MRDIGYYWILFNKSPEVAYWNGDEWVLCGIELECNNFTDEDMKHINEDMIEQNDKPKLRSKGDFMTAVRKLDDRIKEIDSAIPREMIGALMNLGVDPSTMVMIYWKNGKSEVVDIARHYVVLTQNI